MDEGKDSAMRQSLHIAFDNALLRLSSEISMLERLLEEVQGADREPPELKSPTAVKEPLISLTAFLKEGESRVIHLTDRLVQAKNGIREALY
jgi:hypothetical protein